MPAYLTGGPLQRAYLGCLRHCLAPLPCLHGVGLPHYRQSLALWRLHGLRKSRFGPCRPICSGFHASSVVAREQAYTGVSSAGNGAAAGAPPTFQEAIRRLQDYWSSLGCAIWQPYNTEVLFPTQLWPMMPRADHHFQRNLRAAGL